MALFYNISAQRGPENDEMMSEIQGIQAITKLPMEFVKAIQLLEEITAMIMPPISNGTQIVSEPVYPEGFEALSKLSAKNGKCTGIIATNSEDGMVYHARNFDNSPVELFQYLVYEASFQSGGVELYKAQMMAGYTMVITAARFGPNGETPQVVLIL